MNSRRNFLKISASLTGSLLLTPTMLVGKKKPDQVMTVRGSIPASDMGTSLIHEHILVDFGGAEQYDPSQWDRQEVIKKVLPYLEEAKIAGCKTLIDCTPQYLGRDVLLLKRLSDLTGLNIITNTGYYGGSDNKFLPANAFTESATQLSVRWINEWNKGIEGTGTKPGFIKISVNRESLSPISQKLIEAAAQTHLQTGLTIASHTGPAIPAFEEIEILKKAGVSPSAFIWVHAQTEKDKNQYISAAAAGAWVSLDGLNENNVDEYVQMLLHMKKGESLHRTLISHDAGWYDPAKSGGGEFRGYTTLFKKLIPALEQENFSEQDINQLIRENPREAFIVRVRKV